MANIPSDVIQLHILPRLPVKSLIRFKSVSKSWQAWIGSPDFIRLHRHNNRSSDKDRFLVMVDKSSHTIHIHELESPSAPPLLLTYPKAATCTTPIVVEIVASCEGVLLLSCSPRSNRIFIRLRQNLMWARTHVSDELVLLNPSTGSYHDIPHPSIIPDSNDHCSIYGIYHDEANDDYKVAMISQSHNYQSHNYRSTKSREVRVYSSKTNSWTLIEQKLDISYRIEAAAGAVALIGHLLHTILYLKNGDAFTTRIGCFDIMAEQWTNEVPLPDRFEVDLTCNRLCVFDGLLCGVMDDVAGHTYQVWVMKEYGVKESWVKLLNSDIYGPYGLDYYLPVTCHDGSRNNILCRKSYTGELFWYDIKTKKEKKLEFEGCRASSSGHIVCNQSLVNFTGGRQINLFRLEIKEETRKRGREWSNSTDCSRIVTELVIKLKR